MKARRYLTPTEVKSLIAAAGTDRHGKRNQLMLNMMYRHGLRVAELVGMCWEQVDFDGRVLLVKRAKNGRDSVHPLTRYELRGLTTLSARSRDGSGLTMNADRVFVSERNQPITTDGIRKLVRRAGDRAGLVGCHPHMLRHACGYKLANEGHDTRLIQDYLGHRNIQTTVRYTELDANRFKELWK